MGAQSQWNDHLLGNGRYSNLSIITHGNADLPATDQRKRLVENECAHGHLHEREGGVEGEGGIVGKHLDLLT